ncbi:NADP-dependent oxidoreductase [Pseudomonas sp. LRF_L74]|uniref:NADP-dependent oxidoreductase n=1 Tax=Pseudomonas sp. LRF_L74 TaxID=3369422 RepID=UPI003F635026
MATMHAARIHEFGGPEVIRFDDVEIPRPGPGEVLVEVKAASINLVDCKIREGRFPPVCKEQLPLALGRDLAGIVVELGANVTCLALGTPVFAMVDTDGSYADYALVRTENLAVIPSPLDFVSAAAVPLAAQTAWQALFQHGQLHEGQRVLIHGGSGGVGHFAVQFAKAKGAVVYATGSRHSQAFMRAIGADHVIDYRRQRFEHACREMDLVIDLVAGETQVRSWSVLRNGGRLVSTLAEPDMTHPQAAGKSGCFFLVQPNGRQLRTIAQLISDGIVHAALSRTFRLEQAAEAQRYLQQRHVEGKVVMKIER